MSYYETGMPSHVPHLSGLERMSMEPIISEQSWIWKGHLVSCILLAWQDYKLRSGIFASSAKGLGPCWAYSKYLADSLMDWESFSPGSCCSLHRPQWQPQAVCVTGAQMCPCPDVRGVKEDLTLECQEGSSTRPTQYLSASFPSGLVAVALIQLPTVCFLGGVFLPSRLRHLQIFCITSQML